MSSGFVVVVPPHPVNVGVEMTNPDTVVDPAPAAGWLVNVLLAMKAKPPAASAAAPPNRAIFPPLTYASNGSWTLMPVAYITRADDGLAGIQQLAGDATMLYYMTEEGQEGNKAFLEKRKPDFGKFPRLP